MGKVKLLFFNVPENLPLVAELRNKYQRKNDFEVKMLADAREALREVVAEKNGIVFFKIENKDDLQKAVQFLKASRRLVKKGLVRPACLSFVKSKKVGNILRKYGCQDIVDPQMPPKSAGFKVDFWSKNIKAQLKKLQKDEDFKKSLQKSKEQSSGGEGTEGKVSKDGFLEVPALSLASDIWISKHKNDNKKILRRYLSKMMGPSPHVGQWLELEPKPGDKQQSWKFALKDEDAQFILDDGAWFFSGSKPEFDWKIHRWNFSGDRPHLYFYSRDGKVHSKIKFKDGVAQVAKNSTYALTKEPVIEETFDKKYQFEGDGPESEESNTAAGAVDEIDGKLRGEMDGDEPVDGHWDGDNSTDDLGEDKIKGKLAHSLDEEDEEKRTKNQADEYEGHYGGKSKTDHLDNAPYSGEIEGEPDQEKENKKGSAYQEGDFGGSYQGKGSTDELGSDPLEQNLKDQEVGRGGAKNSEFQEDDLGGHYGGEGSTDEVGGDPLSGKLKPNSKDSECEKNSEYQEDDLGGHYAGESGDDELERDPLADSLSPDKKKKNKNNGSDYSEGDLGGHYGGKEAPRKDMERNPLAEDFRSAKVAQARGTYPEDEPEREMRDLFPPSAKQDQSGNKEEEMLDALGDGLTRESKRNLEKSGLLDKVVPGQEGAAKKETDLDQIIGAPVKVNTESGELKVTLKFSKDGAAVTDMICAFEDFFPDELVVVVPSGSLRVDTDVAATVRLMYGGEKRSISAEGKVYEVEVFEKGQETVTISFEKAIDEKKYQAFTELYQERQESIHEFMLLAKGYE